MPIQPSIDDTNTTLITYEGTWELLIGSTRQWESSVHSTLTPGSSATFRFRGYQVWVWGTIPAGVGSNLVDFSIDGGTPNVTSRTSNGSAVYDEQYYASPILRETYHTIVVTNRGSNENGNTEFQLDRFQFETSDTVPLFTPSGASITPTSVPTSSATGTSGGTISSGGSKTPVGAITGAVIGALAVIIAILLYLLWRRRKGHGEDSSSNEKVITSGRTFFHRRSGLVPTPFPLNESVSAPSHSTADPVSEAGSSVNPQPRTSNAANPVIMEKSGYRNFHPESLPSSTANNAYTDVGERESLPTALASSTTSQGMTGSNPQSPPIATEVSPTNDGASSMYAPHSTRVEPSAAVRSPMSEISSGVESDAFDQPPPSYWQDNQGNVVRGPCIVRHIRAATHFLYSYRRFS